MLIFNKKSELSAFLSPFIDLHKSVGFVPTMGALHQGHLSLIEKSLAENDITVMSIFVNPTQFNSAEDLDKYPRTLEKDLQKLSQLSHSILVYAPEIADIYEGNTVSESFEYDGLEHQMEGQHRPGHFDGVGTIVKRLFEIVKKLVEKHALPVHIIGCPIYREKSGLAMSSRNERLSDTARNKAAILFEILQQAKTTFNQKSIADTIAFVKTEFEKHPEFELEYFEIADEATLLSVDNKVSNQKYRGFIAVFIEKIRLIDNISLN